MKIRISWLGAGIIFFFSGIWLLSLIVGLPEFAATSKIDDLLDVAKDETKTLAVRDWALTEYLSWWEGKEGFWCSNQDQRCTVGDHIAEIEAVRKDSAGLMFLQGHAIEYMRSHGYWRGGGILGIMVLGWFPVALSLLMAITASETASKKSLDWDSKTAMSELEPIKITEIIEAWRLWNVVYTTHGPRLTSLNDNTIWEPFIALRAQCNYRHSRDVPDQWCSCGIYATRHKSRPGDKIAGRVKLWGTIYEHTDGTYRAEFAYPDTFMGSNRELIAELSRIYGLGGENDCYWESRQENPFHSAN